MTTTPPLYVSDSTLGKDVGKGLFAGRDFSKGEKVIEYTGELLTEEQYYQRYGNELGTYVLQLPGKLYIDAREETSGLARYVNDCRTSDRKRICKSNNMEMRAKNGAKRAFLYATKPIRKGEELFFSYGRQYWKKQL